MNRYANKKKIKYIKGFEGLVSLLDDSNDLTKRCKFNFSYFISNQDAGQVFTDWNHKQLTDLLNKFKSYSASPLDFWRNERVGGGGLKVLEIYGGFPSKSDFTEPKGIPHEVQWGRFRLGAKGRLAGFTIPTHLHNNAHSETGEFFDKNTFYVVFLDRDHRFYITEKP